MAGEDGTVLEEGAHLQPRHESPTADGVDGESPWSRRTDSERAMMFKAHHLTEISSTTGRVYLHFCKYIGIGKCIYVHMNYIYDTYI